MDVYTPFQHTFVYKQLEVNFTSDDPFKIVLSGFTKDVRWRIIAEKAWTFIFAPDLIEYLFVKFMEENIQMNHAIY